MNKKTLLVLTFAFLLAFAGMQAFAQSTADQASPAAQAGQGVDPDVRAKVQAKLQDLSSQLNLTDEQKAQIKPILQDEVQQLKALHDDASLSPDQKKAKVAEIYQSHKSQIGAVLTPEQQKKLETMKEERQER